MKKENELNRNISEYSDWNLLLTLSKPEKSISVISFFADPEDSWLIDVVTYKIKSGAIKDTCMIIKKDVPTWISHMKTIGYSIHTWAK